MTTTTLATRDLTPPIATEIHADNKTYDPDSSRMLTRTKLAGEEPFA
jgi:hypothetical protein